MYAKCRICEQEMAVGNGCTFHHLELDEKKIVQRVPYNGAECHDCNVVKGQYHHAGCDMETCPLCGGQFISCLCQNVVAWAQIP